MRNFLLMSMSFGLLFSCNKDGSKNSSLNYMPLAKGNYWVYEVYEVDTSNISTNTGILDSLFIDRDTIIDGIQFFILEGDNHPFTSSGNNYYEILRDSSGYILNHNGDTQLAPDNFGEILQSNTVVLPNGDSLYTIEYKMRNSVKKIETTAGLFDVINYHGTVTYIKNVQGIPDTRNMNNYYSENVGKVLVSLFYFNNPDNIEKRLLRYHVN